MTTSIEAVALEAWENRQAILRYHGEVKRGFVALARLLKENRDKAYYKLLGHDSFEEFLADPELAFRRSTAFMLISHYELYIEHLKLAEDDIAAIGSRRLSIIKPVVEADPERWLANAREMSKSDLVNEVRQARGLPELSVLPEILEEKKTVDAPATVFSSPTRYVKYVKSSPCCVCGNVGGGAVDPAHFPKTAGAGGKAWHVIPLCRECHTAYHGEGVDSFFSKYKHKIM